MKDLLFIHLWIWDNLMVRCFLISLYGFQDSSWHDGKDLLWVGLKLGFIYESIPCWTYQNVSWNILSIIDLAKIRKVSGNLDCIWRRKILAIKDKFSITPHKVLLPLYILDSNVKYMNTESKRRINKLICIDVYMQGANENLIWKQKNCWNRFPMRDIALYPRAVVAWPSIWTDKVY